MEISRKERKELDALSKEVFGTSSRWHKLVTSGHGELLTEEKTETVPPAKEGEESTTKTVNVPVKTSFGANKLITKHYTVESVKAMMLEQKTRIEQIKEQIKKHYDDMKAAKEAEERTKQLNDQFSGSAKV